MSSQNGSGAHAARSTRRCTMRAASCAPRSPQKAFRSRRRRKESGRARAMHLMTETIDSTRFSRSGRPHVVIAGAGVAGLETLMALRALAGDRVDITIVAPELKFFNRSMSVEEPFTPKRGRGIRLADVAAEFDARWVRAELDGVIPEQRAAITRKHGRLSYDRLVLALGARPDQWMSRSLSY